MSRPTPRSSTRAIVGSDYYDRQIGKPALQGVDIEDVLRRITTRDVSWACDLLRPAYDATDGVDGRMSIEVDPRLTESLEQMLAAAKRGGGNGDDPT